MIYWWFGDFLVQYFRDGFSRHWESSWPGKHLKMNSKLSYRLMLPVLKDVFV